MSHCSVINGEFRQYRGTRDLNALMSFIEEKKWETVEPVSAWKRPDSIQMSIVSYFFKLSHFLKVSVLIFETEKFRKEETKERRDTV